VGHPTANGGGPTGNSVMNLSSFEGQNQKDQVRHFIFMPSRSKDEVELPDKRTDNSLLIGLSISEMLPGVNSGPISTYCMCF